MVQTAIKLNPDERLKYESVGKSLLSIPAQGSPEALTRIGDVAAAGRVPVKDVEKRAEAAAAGTAAGTPPGAVQPLNLIFPDGTKKAFDRSTQQPEIIAAFENGAVAVSLGVQAETPGALIGGQPAIKELRTQETATRVVLGDIQRMKQQLAEGGTFTSVVSSAVRSVNSLVGTALQASAALGFDERNLLNPESYELENFFGEEAAKSAAFRSNVVKLAYALARSNDPGARLTEPDVENALEQLGTDSGDKAVIAATLDEVASGAVRGFEAAFKTADRQSPGNFGKFPPDFADLLKPLGATDDDSQKLPEGIPPGSRLLDQKTKKGELVYETPTGERLVVF
jgi:hypothetical protein